jgi:hypothetical protein
MAHKQTVADRTMGETSMMTRMVGTEARDADLCPRCSGLMVDERYYDFTGGLAFQGVRCVNCGEMLDPLICVHRYQRPDSRHRSRYVGR